MDAGGATKVLSWRCALCRMRTDVKLFGLALCGICRDQIQDFAWASMIQGTLVAVGIIGGFQVLIEEVLLLLILVLVKHRLPGFFDRFERRA